MADVTISMTIPDAYVGRLQAWLQDAENGVNCNRFTSDVRPAVSDSLCFKLLLSEYALEELEKYEKSLIQDTADEDKSAVTKIEIT